MKVETGKSLCCLQLSVNPLRTAMRIRSAFILPLELNLIYDLILLCSPQRGMLSSRPAFNGRSRFTLT